VSNSGNEDCDEQVVKKPILSSAGQWLNTKCTSVVCEHLVKQRRYIPAGRRRLDVRDILCMLPVRSSTPDNDLARKTEIPDELALKEFEDEKTNMGQN
jgi:hypothetical protein